MTGVQGNPLGLTVTDVEQEYDPNVIRRLVEAIRDIYEHAHSDRKNVEIVGAPDSAGRRTHLVLRSPDGNLWQVDVTDAGALITTLIPFDPAVQTRGPGSLL